VSRAPRPPLTIRKALLVVATVACLACACIAASALAATTIHFQRESLPALESQLRKGEVHALAFHPAAGTGHIHISLNNGGHMTVAYATSEQAQLVARARGAGVPVAIAVAKPKAAKTVHHKLRYIAGGIVIVVIVVVAAVLLVDRRRTLAEAGGGAPASSSPGDST
jgi:hypothetical protein